MCINEISKSFCNRYHFRDFSTFSSKENNKFNINSISSSHTSELFLFQKWKVWTRKKQFSNEKGAKYTLFLYLFIFWKEKKNWKIALSCSIQCRNRFYRKLFLIFFFCISFEIHCIKTNKINPLAFWNKFSMLFCSLN